VSKQMTI